MKKIILGIAVLLFVCLGVFLCFSCHKEYVCFSFDDGVVYIGDGSDLYDSDNILVDENGEGIDNILVDENGEGIEFTSMIAALNYMGEKGWNVEYGGIDPFFVILGKYVLWGDATEDIMTLGKYKAQQRK